VSTVEAIFLFERRDTQTDKVTDATDSNAELRYHRGRVGN